MKILAAVFSYNRFIGLRNAVASLYRHIPTAHVLVVDDGSNDPRVRAFCEKQQGSPGGFDFIIAGKESAGGPTRMGGLYNNMNMAVDWALARDFDLILFMQDDQQMLWAPTDFTERSVAFLRDVPDALMLDVRFVRRIRYLDTYAWVRSIGAYIMPRGCADVGLMLVSRLTESGFRFMDSEAQNSLHALNLGFRMYAMRDPVIADIPLAYSGHSWDLARGRLHLWDEANESRYEQTPILDDLVAEDRRRILSRNPAEMAFVDDYARPTLSRKLFRPYAFNSKFIQRYCQLSWSCYRTERSRGQKPAHVQIAETPAKAIIALSPQPQKQPVARPACPTMERLARVVRHITGRMWFFVFVFFLYPRVRRWFDTP